MRRALLAIGVNRTESCFPALNAASMGAKQIYDWGTRQGFDCVLLTDDDDKEVRHTDVYDAVDLFVKKGVYDQLVLYFSGHGVLMAPDCEAWLLSRAPNNQNEAINVAGSIANARTCNIGNIVVFSDACRSVPAQWSSAMLTPGTVFPVRVPRSPAPEVDVFYATLPGNPAYEVPPNQASQSYRGLLTDCLMQALNGKVAAVIVREHSRHVVPARPLKVYLAQAIPDAATQVSITLTQSPDARVESVLPIYLSDVTATSIEHEVVSNTVRTETAGTINSSLSLSQTVNRIQNRVFSRHHLFGRTAVSLGGIPGDKRVRTSMKKILDADSHSNFNYITGFTVRGTEVKSAHVTGRSCDVIAEKGGAQIHVHEGLVDGKYLSQRGQRTAFIRFSDGSGVIFAVLDGYVGSIVVEGEQVISVSYTPTPSSRNYWEYKEVAESLDQRRAFVAVAARNGKFRLKKANDAAAYLRVLKRIDPTLGIYAAYAYAQAGNYDGVRSIFRYMNNSAEPVPFDVAMLAMQFEMEQHISLNFAPGLPMLTQGWLSLGRFEASMPSPLRAARRYLKPSLWTTFSKEGMDILEYGLLEGQ